MLEVDIDKILPVTEARDNFNKIVDEVEGTDHMYVLTKNGKPSAVIVGVNHLEKLTGKTADELTSIVEKKADETPVVEEVVPASPADTNVADGSKPLETDVPIPGPVQADSATDSAPIDVPVETAPAPTSSPGDATTTPATSAEAPSEGASNQAFAAAPTENGAATNDSDLFV